MGRITCVSIDTPPCRAIRLEDRDLQPGPVAKKAFELYMEFAETQRR